MDILAILSELPSQTIRASLIGGFILSLSTSLYYIFFGNILGMSGLLSSQIVSPSTESLKKLLIILGLLLSSLLAQLLLPRDSQPFDDPTYQSSATQLFISGLLVGFGTFYSSGCTSGHGLCGLPRLSLRSFVSVVVFLSVAVLTATLGLHAFIPTINISLPSIPPIWLLVAVCIGTCLLFAGLQAPSHHKLVLLIIGVVFGCGLMVSGMSKRSKIYGFLELDATWDPSLLIVLMTGVGFNLITFSLMRYVFKYAVFGGKVSDSHGSVDNQMVVGAAIFGVGWGLGGLCPGPYMLSFVHSPHIALLWGVGFVGGRKIAEVVRSSILTDKMH